MFGLYVVSLIYFHGRGPVKFADPRTRAPVCSHSLGRAIGSWRRSVEGAPGRGPRLAPAAVSPRGLRARFRSQSEAHHLRNIPKLELFHDVMLVDLDRSSAYAEGCGNLLGMQARGRELQYFAFTGG